MSSSTRIDIGERTISLTPEHICILKVFRNRQTVTVDEVKKALEDSFPGKGEGGVQQIHILKGKGLIRNESRQRGIYSRTFLGKQIIQTLALRRKFE